MARLTFLGATGTVTGSRFLLEIENQKLLIDCGMFQGKKENRLKNWESFPVDPSEISKIFLTHAHIDHSGFLPRLYKNGFRGEIVCTKATFELCDIMLRDSAHIQEEDAEYANKKGFSKHAPALPLYTMDDAVNVLELFNPVHYGDEIYISDRVRIKLKDAGHILGSAFVDIKSRTNGYTRKMVFSGDLGRPEDAILRDPFQAFNVDYLVLESTYGNRLHDHRERTEELIRVINESIDRGGVLLIPSFAIGRTQTLLYTLRELEEQGKIPSVPIFVDSPMAIDATQIFKGHIPDLNIKNRMLTLEHKKIFHPRGLKICRTRDESKGINEIKNRAIIISASGMVTGGRILHHMAARLPKKNNTILFIGYQAEGTRGRTMIEGAKHVKIHGANVPINATIESITGFSGHADYEEILAWLMGFNHKPEKTFLVHGEPEASASLAQKIQNQFKWDVEIPEFENSFELDL